MKTLPTCDVIARLETLCRKLDDQIDALDTYGDQLDRMAVRFGWIETALPADAEELEIALPASPEDEKELADLERAAEASDYFEALAEGRNPWYR